MKNGILPLHPKASSPDNINYKKLCSGSLNPPSGNLSPVQSSQGSSGNGILILALLDLNIGSAKDDLHMRRVTLVRVDTTMSTVCATTGFLPEDGYFRI